MDIGVARPRHLTQGAPDAKAPATLDREAGKAAASPPSPHGSVRRPGYSTNSLDSGPTFH